MPIVFAVIQILLYLTVCQHEPINFSIVNGQENDAKQLIKKVYKINKKDGMETDEPTLERLLNNFIENEKSNTNMESNEITFNDAVFGNKYGKATWICFFLNIFNQGSGVGAIAIYIPLMLMNLNEVTNG